MPLEIRMLAWGIVLGVVQLLPASAWAASERGLKGSAGPHDGASAPLPPLAGRAERALHNFLETFPLPAAAGLAVAATGRTGALSALGVAAVFLGTAGLPAAVSGGRAVAAQPDLGRVGTGAVGPAGGMSGRS